MKPKLPDVLAKKLPEDVLRYLYTFVPHNDLPPKPRLPKNADIHLKKIQSSPKRNPMDLFGLDDFVLS